MLGRGVVLPPGADGIGVRVVVLLALRIDLAGKGAFAGMSKKTPDSMCEGTAVPYLFYKLAYTTSGWYQPSIKILATMFPAEIKLECFIFQVESGYSRRMSVNACNMLITNRP